MKSEKSCGACREKCLGEKRKGKGCRRLGHRVQKQGGRKSKSGQGALRNKIGLIDSEGQRGRELQ